MGQKSAPSTTQTQNSTMSTGQENEWNNQLQNVNQTVGNDISSVNYGQLQGQLGQQAQNIEGQQVNAAGIAAPIAAAGSQSFTSPGVAQSFMDPYENTSLANQVGVATSTELNPQLASMQRSNAASGSLGGSRGAIDQSLATQGFNQNMNSMIAQGENTAYNTGEQQFNTQNALNLQGQTAAAQTQLAGANSNVYANLAASQPEMQQIQASEAPGQQVMQETQALASQPKEGTNQTTQVTSPGSSGILGDIGSLAGAASQFFYAEGGIVGSGKRPSANVGVPFEQYSAGYSKGGITAGKKAKKQVKKGKK